MRILELPASKPKKFRAKRAEKGTDSQKEQQLDLFSSGRILKLHPDSPFDKALELDERGDKEAAVSFYQKAVEVGDQPADAYCNLGILEAQNNNIVNAINYLTLSLKHNPRHLEAHFNLANVYVETGNKELGILHYELAIKIAPTFTSSYFNLGLTLAAERQYQKAINVLNQYRQFCSVHQHKPAIEMIQKLQSMI